MENTVKSTKMWFTYLLLSCLNKSYRRWGNRDIREDWHFLWAGWRLEVIAKIFLFHFTSWCGFSSCKHTINIYVIFFSGEESPLLTQVRPREFFSSEINKVRFRKDGDHGLRRELLLLLLYFGAVQPKSSVPARKLMGERWMECGPLLTVSTCREGGLWPQMASTLQAPSSDTCRIFLSSLGKASYSFHFPSLFVSSPTCRWLSFHKAFLIFPFPGPAVCQGTGGCVVGYKLPSTILNSHQGCSKQTPLQWCADFQE